MANTEWSRERHQPDLGQAGRRAEHGLLGHAHLEEPVRVGVAEDVHVGVLGQVRGEPDDLGRSSASFGSACPNGAGAVFWPGSANEAIIADVVSFFLRGSVVVIGSVPGVVACSGVTGGELVAGDLPLVLGRRA